MGGIWIPWLIDCANAAVAGTKYQVVVVDGYQTRGHGGFRALEGVVGHHTGTADSAQGDYPTLRIVRDGRSDLLGPLCNYGLGRSGTIYVVAAGVAWHAGASAYQGMVDLNDEFLGIEAESAGGGKWTPDQMIVYPRLVRSILDYIRRPASRYASHRTVATPKGRKDDPRGIDDVWMQQAAGAVVLGELNAVQQLAGKDGQPVNDIEIYKTSDTTFRGGATCECGNNSAVIDHGWITFGTLWGDAEVIITFLSGGKVLGTQFKQRLTANQDSYVQIPSGTRLVTVEGTCSKGAIIAASRVLVPR